MWITGDREKNLKCDCVHLEHETFLKRVGSMCEPLE
jgi:hypothetical protein